MISSNKLIPLEYNTNFFIEKSSLFNIEMSFFKYLLMTTLLILIILGSIFFINSLKNDNQPEDKSFDIQIGVNVNENDQNEFYKIVDGEKQQLSEEDIKNLEDAQKTINTDNFIDLDGYEQGSSNLILSN
jgi:hypothetical protein